MGEMIRRYLSVVGVTDAGDEERELRFYCGWGHFDGESGLKELDDKLWDDRVSLGLRMWLVTGRWICDLIEG